MLSLIWAVAGAAAWSAQPPINRVAGSTIAIGIVREAGQTTLFTDGEFSAVDQISGDRYDLEPSTEYRLAAIGPEKLSLGGREFGGRIRLIPSKEGNAIHIGRKKYQGSLLIRSKTNGTFTIVNELGIEEYLYGVVPAEMSPDWPVEALKAQAVVARTFALANLGKYHAEGFDLSDDSLSQKYNDVAKRYPAATRAVQETQGEVLTWDGQILKAFFHSCCGGHTCAIGVIWGTPSESPKPLRGVSDRFCRRSPNSEWSSFFSTDEIENVMQKHGHPALEVRTIRVGERDTSSGFVKTLRILSHHRWIDVRANDLRNWLGNKDIKSTKIYRIVARKDGYVFVGKGFGHGVGLCQWGTKAMAEKGKNYRAILKYYFPGSKLETRED